MREDDQYDQQDIEFQIHVKEAQDEHNRAITKFFNDYIAFIEAYRTVHKTYGVFLNQYIHKNSNFPTDIEVAKLFEVFNQTEPYGFKKNSCSMTSFGYKTLKNENHGLSSVRRSHLPISALFCTMICSTVSGKNTFRTVAGIAESGF